MKIFLRIILAIVMGFIVYGYYKNYSNVGAGEKFIGLGVLLFGFVLMPIFIYHRYKNKDLSSYSLKKSGEEKEEKN